MKDPERTRNALLKAAFQEVHRKGFKAASLSEILARTDLTKGAFYHHFPNKLALGHALLDAIEGRIVARWQEALKAGADPITCLQATAREAFDTMTVEEVELGCPLNNLAQEMSSLDESFRIKVAAIYETWRSGIAQALAEGQKRGIVTRNINPDEAALFCIAALSGSRGLAKNARSSAILRSCLQGFFHYLESLRV